MRIVHVMPTSRQTMKVLGTTSNRILYPDYATGYRVMTFDAINRTQLAQSGHGRLYCFDTSSVGRGNDRAPLFVRDKE